jgi:hypothetical protein
MKTFKTAFGIVREAWRPYIVLSLVYFGLIVCAMVYSNFDRSLQKGLMDEIGMVFTQGPLSTVLGAYTGGQVLLAVALTFVVNLIGGSFVAITLPSLIIPFSGLLVAGFRAILWGLIFTPTSFEAGANSILIGILLVLLLFLEGQGYVLAMLAAYLQGVAFLWPHKVGAESHLQGYGSGLKQSLHLYLLVMLVLVIAAVYESVIAILIMPAMQ